MFSVFVWDLTVGSFTVLRVLTVFSFTSLSSFSTIPGVHWTVCSLVSNTTTTWVTTTVGLPVQPVPPVFPVSLSYETSYCYPYTGIRLRLLLQWRCELFKAGLSFRSSPYPSLCWPLSHCHITVCFSPGWRLNALQQVALVVICVAGPPVSFGVEKFNGTNRLWIMQR